MPIVMVGHLLEVASAAVFTACRHKVAAAGGQRLSISLQVRARAEANIDQSRVPASLRRTTGQPRKMSVHQAVSRGVGEERAGRGGESGVEEERGPRR